MKEPGFSNILILILVFAVIIGGIFIIKSKKTGSAAPFPKNFKFILFIAFCGIVLILCFMTNLCGFNDQ